MRIEITYYSDDGEEFETEEECLEYERSIRENFSSLIFFNEKMDKINDPDLYKVESDAYYFYTLEDIKSENAIEWINSQIGNLLICDPIVKEHFYGYDESENAFIDITYRVSNLTETIKTLTENLKK